MGTILFVACWLFGLALGDALSIAWYWAAGAGAIAGAGLIVFRRRRRQQQMALYLLALALGVGRLALATPVIDASSLSWYNDRGTVEVVGIVIERPDILGERQSLRLRASHVAGEGFDVDVAGDVWVTLGGYSRYRYGDQVRLTGRLVTPPRYVDFDYRQLLAQRGIYSLMQQPESHLLARDQGKWLLRQIYGFKDRVIGVATDILPMPQSALLAGMLVGDESGIPDPLDEAFRTTGTSHIVVISGWNVALFAGLTLALCGPLVGRRVSLWLALAVVVGYTVLVGFDPPIVRAAIMGGLTLLALLAGRQTLALNSLALAALAMTVLNPYMLWELGFQLSFAATLGLILFQPPLKRATYRLLTRWGAAGQLWLTRALDDLIIVTLSAQILVTPLLVYRFDRLTLITLPANLLVLPAQAPLLGLGALAALGGLIWLPLGQALGWLAWPFLTYTVRVVEWLARAPAATVSVPRISPALWILYCALAIGLAIVAGWDADRRRQWWLRVKRAVPAYAGVMALALSVALLWTAVFSLPDGKLHVHFLDVGQGDAILICSPAGRRILIDGGPDGRRLLSAVDRRLPFWSRKLDAVLVTHGDGDHINGLFAAMDHYRVDLALDAGFGSDVELGDRWRQAIIDGGARWQTAEPGLRLALSDGVTLEVLHPPVDQGAGWSSNDRSVVVRLSYGDVHMLLTGDLEQAGEAALLASGKLIDSQVLKVSHHGAAAGTSEALLDAVSPALAVISVGSANRYGHPAPATLRRLEERGVSVWRTDDAGAVEVIADGVNLWVRGRR
jgi:competence protein ComEC